LFAGDKRCAKRGPERLAARRVQVALSDRRVQARKPMGESRSTAPADPRETSRWRKPLRAAPAVERQFGRLKNEWALLPLRVRGLDRVALHADLTIFAWLACVLTRARAASPAAQPDDFSDQKHGGIDSGQSVAPNDHQRS
jgi:hypothetical protein